MERIAASAPGRICLFGEHQDYLGLPVVAAAISLEITAKGTPTEGSTLLVNMPDIGRGVELKPNAPQRYEGPRDYLRSCLSVLQRRGFTWSRGWRVEIRSSIPINAGVSSSSALVVMWLRFLMAIADQPITPEPEELARFGHEAEVLEFREPGGMMDHFCAAVGGVLHIDTVPPYGCEALAAPLTGIVLGNSREPKATLETLAARRADVNEGLRLLKEWLPDFDLPKTPLDSVEPCLPKLPPRIARRLKANLVNRDLTQQGLAAIRSGDIPAVGNLLLRHHEQLRDGLDLSTPKVERMIEAAMTAGALGGKINGSGGGGCMFVLAPGHEEEVAEAIRREDGDAYIVRVAPGARVFRW